VRTSFHHQSEAQPPNGPLTAATSPDTPSHMPSQAVCFQRVLKRTALETFPYGSFGYVDGMPLPDTSGGALELC
jgi:hypothetical protein